VDERGFVFFTHYDSRYVSLTSSLNELETEKEMRLTRIQMLPLLFGGEVKITLKFLLKNPKGLMRQV
jgi:hypothetical protein